jgi:hypothetical protein
MAKYDKRPVIQYEMEAKWFHKAQWCESMKKV